MDGYDNAKARRRGGLFKQINLLRSRWPVFYLFALPLATFLLTAITLSLSGAVGVNNPPANDVTKSSIRGDAAVGNAEQRRELNEDSAKTSNDRDAAATTSLHSAESAQGLERDKGGTGEGASTDPRGGGQREDVDKSAERQRQRRDWRLGRQRLGLSQGDREGQGNLHHGTLRRWRGGHGNARAVGAAGEDAVARDVQGASTAGAEGRERARGGGRERPSRADGHEAADAQGEDDGQPQEQQQLLWRERQQRVAAAFRHAWQGYRQYAWGWDELLPEAKEGADGLGSLGATCVDALDTAMLMGHADIVKEAGEWVANELPKKIAAAGQVNLFETTIRVLGGLLTAFHLRNASVALRQQQQQQAGEEHAGSRPLPRMRRSWSSRDAATYSLIPDAGPPAEAYLSVARDLGERLLTAFSMSHTPVALSDVFLRERRAQRAGYGGASSTAECTTVQMEFLELSRLTGDPSFGDAAMKVMEHIQGLPKSDGLVPIYIDPDSGHFVGQEIRLGSRGDSYYEYLVKVWLQQGRRPAFLRRMFDESMGGVKKWLVAQSRPQGLTFVAERPSGVQGPLHPKMDHLVCFLPGALVLGATGGLTLQRAQKAGLLTPTAQYYMQLARNLTHACYEMYNVTATGLAPEIAYFNMEGGEGRDGTTPTSLYGADIQIHAQDRHNLLRPETVEALFYMHRTTGEPQYREWGWRIFESFEKYTRVGSGGYVSLRDVTQIPPRVGDKMETFFLGETLKYFFLLFGEDSVLPLHRFVFNTEAHPLPVVPQLQRMGEVGEKGSIS